MLYRFIFGVFLLTLGLNQSAYAKTLELTSDNFVFTGDISESNGRLLIKDLELFRSTLLNLLGASGKKSEIRPVQIYGLKGYSALKKYSGLSGIDGAYTTSDSGPIYLMNTSGGMDRNDDARRTALHEYTHHIISRYTTEYFPLWYNEGFAEYFASFYQEGDRVIIGDPKTHYNEYLDEGSWIDISVMLKSISKYPFERKETVPSYNASARFYGQSWIMVHYIMNDRKLSSKLGPYIKAINDDVEPIKAFEDAFGLSADEFGAQVKRYWKANAFPIIQFEVKEEIGTSSVKVRELSRAEAKSAMALGRINFGKTNKKHQAGIRKEFARLKSSGDKSANVLLGLSHLAINQQDYDTALTLAQDAINIDPSNANAYYLAGDAYFHRYYSTALEDTFQIITANEYFGKQLALDPSHPTGNTHYLRSYLTANQLTSPAPAQLSDSAHFVFSYFRNPKNVGHLLLASKALSVTGKRT